MYMRNDTLYKTAYNKYVFNWRNPGSFFYSFFRVSTVTWLQNWSDSDEKISTCYKTLKLDSSLSNMWFMYTKSKLYLWLRIDF